MERYETKRLMVQAERFDLYRKPWPRSVETIIGDIGVPHPVIIGVQGNINLGHGDWIVYLPLGVVTMNDELFNTLFVKHEKYPTVALARELASYGSSETVEPLTDVQPSDGEVPLPFPAVM